MTVIDKVVRIGRGPYGSVFCKIQFNKDGKEKLSISGVEGPKKNGNAKGSCGQIDMHPWGIIEYATGWDRGLETKFRAVWKKYHLNDMQAGTPAQTEVVERRKPEYPGYPKSHYEWALEVLKEEGLDIDNGYKYGSKWLRIDVSEDAIKFLQSLPNTDVTPAWV